MSEAERIQVARAVQTWVTLSPAPQFFRQEKNNYSVFLTRSVQDQASAQAEGVTGTGISGWQGPVPKAMGPDLCVCAPQETVWSRYRSLGPMHLLRILDPTVESFRCSLQSDSQSPDLFQLAGKPQFNEQSVSSGYTQHRSLGKLGPTREEAEITEVKLKPSLGYFSIKGKMAPVW